MEDRIAQEVGRLHAELVDRHKGNSLSGRLSIALLHPKLAIELKGYHYDERPIPDWPPDRRVKIAGLVDPQRREVVVSDEFDRPSMRFTGAHELAHIVLHEPKSLLRERPVDGMRQGVKKRLEREADIFGARFLMPEILMCAAFEQTFGVQPPIRLDDNLAHWLSPQNPREVLFAEPGSLLPFRRLAQLSPRPMHLSLSEQFEVSITTMAIRLQELKFMTV